MMTLSRWKIIAVVAAAVFGLLFTLPNLLPAQTLAALPPFLPHQKLNLGLDLQGGSYLLYEVDTNALRAERLNNLTEEVGNTMREDNVEVTDPTQSNGVISIRVTDPAKVDTAAASIRKKLASPLGGAVGGGADILVQTKPDQRIEISYTPQALAADAAKAVDQDIEVIRRRIDSLGTKEPAINRQGVNRIVVQAPGESDPERLKEIIGKTAKLSFQMVDETTTPEDVAAGRIPRRFIQLPSEEGGPMILDRRAVVTGEMLTDAHQSFNPQTGAAEVTFRFNGVGGRRFGDTTAKNIGKRFAIVLDNKVISAPVIQSAITGGSGVIQGNYTPESANNLALLLRSGALPAPLHVEDQRTVTAELGADAVKAGSISLAIGALAMFVFIILAYGLFGVFAAVALVVNVLMIIGIMSMTQATLTFPGIAGLILTLAVAVDANVLIYERMRDEAHGGRTPMAAADVGFKRALVSIMDANITSLISAIIMFSFGSGPVKGFAWTLSIGVFTSVFTAVLITQVMISLWFRAKRRTALPIA